MPAPRQNQLYPPALTPVQTHLYVEVVGEVEEEEAIKVEEATKKDQIRGVLKAVVEAQRHL